MDADALLAFLNQPLIIAAPRSRCSRLVRGRPWVGSSCVAPNDKDECKGKGKSIHIKKNLCENERSTGAAGRRKADSDTTCPCRVARPHPPRNFVPALRGISVRVRQSRVFLSFRGLPKGAIFKRAVHLTPPPPPLRQQRSFPFVPSVVFCESGVRNYGSIFLRWRLLRLSKGLARLSRRVA